MDSLLRIIASIVVLIEVILSKDIPVSSNYELRHKESCPGPGFYYPGPCYICFCNEKNLATCWVREGRQCDAERLQQMNARVRRSPKGLRKPVLDDVSNKRLPKQCEPYQSSYDACAPADWCRRGCNVCDCDANGRWNCHILSFCNKDNTKTVKDYRVSSTTMSTRRAYHLGKIKPQSINNVKKPKKIVKSILKQQIKKNKLKNNGIQTNNYTSKLNNNARKYEKNVRKSNKTKSFNNKRSQQKTIQNAQKKYTNKIQERKSKTGKKPQYKRTINNKQSKITKASKNKLKNNRVNVATTHKPQGKFLTLPKGNFKSSVSKTMNVKNDHGKSALGRRIINRVMSTAQKRKSMVMINVQNTTGVRRSTDDQNKRAMMNDKKINYNSRQNKLKSYTRQKKDNFRKKREILDTNLSIIDLKDASNLEKVIDDNTHLAYLSVKRITKNDTVQNFGDLNVTKTKLIYNTVTNKDIDNITTEKGTTTKKLSVLNSTIDNVMYYKYSIDKISSNVTTSTEVITTKVEINKTRIVVTDKSKNITGKITERTKQHAINMSDPEFNKPKYKNWEEMPILRNKNDEIEINKALYFDSRNRKYNDSLNKRLENNMFTKEIKRKLDVTNKHKLQKMISNNFETISINFSSRQFTVNNSQKNNKTSSIQTFLQNLVTELNKNTTELRNIKTKFSLFKYLRKIFRKIFSEKKGNHLKQSNKINEDHTLEILCENIRACYMNKHNKIALRSKIHDLNRESEKIFKSFKIVKSLLNFIDLPVSQENTSKKKLTNDLHKLDAILKGMYAAVEDTSMTHKSHIKYVKKNLHQFINSVGRFASIVSEIIDVLYKNNKKYAWKIQKKKLNSFNKIKNLLIKHNIVQNKFMKKMYQLLTDTEKKVTTENPKLSYIEINNTQVMDRYSNNIIENIRKLKNLAQALNSSRRKRQTMRENDAMEYLLMLMEYMMKQNYPFNTAPVNDGIDLLIEAIQNAPNIKPVEKKVIDSLPSNTTATPINSIKFRYSKEDSISDSDIISAEENLSSKNENNLLIKQAVDNIDDITQIVFDNQFNDTSVINEYDTTTEYSVKDKQIERTDFNRISKEENTSSSNENILAIEHVEDDKEVTQLVYYKKYDDTKKNNAYDTAYATDNTDKTKYVNPKNEKKGEKTGFDRFLSAIGDTRQYEVFSSELENEEKPVVKSTTIPIRVLSKENKSDTLSVQDFKLDDDPVNVKDTKQYWIEENFGKEIRDYSNDIFFNLSDNTSSLTKTYSPKVTTKSMDQNYNNINSITVPLEEEDTNHRSKVPAEVKHRKQNPVTMKAEYRNKKSKVTSDEVMHRKQTQLLNSLDYGTERNEFDESESNDDADSFPAYFVK